MITQDIIKKLWEAQGFGNIAIWEDESMTLVPAGLTGEPEGKKPLVVLKPIALVTEFSLLDFALHDEQLLTKIEEEVRSAGGKISRA